MATSNEGGNAEGFSENVCGPCKIGDENIIAVSFCEECNQYLCNNCDKTHKRLAVSRNHTVKEKDNMQTNSALKTNVTDIPEKCLAHPTQEIALYCTSHNELCCSQCLSLGHKICIDVKSVTNYLSIFDIHKEEKELSSKMLTLSDEVSKTMTLVQASVNVIECCHGEAQSRMLEAKRSAIDHIETLYGTLSDHLNKMRDRDLNIILPYRYKCNAVSFDIDTLESYFRDKTKYSKKQLFLAIRKADAKVDVHCHELSEIRSRNPLTVTRYRFKPDAAITDLKRNPSTFGSLDVQHDAIKSTAILKSLTIKDVNDEKNCCITGLSFVSSNHLVATDSLNSSVKLIDINENKVISNMKLESAPWDVTSVTRNKVAVTIPEEKMIQLLSIDEDSTFDRAYEKRITCSNKCYGITKHKDTFLVTIIQEKGENKLEQYDIEGSLLLTVGVNASKPKYVICNEDQSRIYVSDSATFGYIIELRSEDFTKLGTMRSCSYDVNGMTADKTGILYYCNSGYRDIDVAYSNKKQGNEWKRHNLISDKTSKSNCLVFCIETSRLFVGLDGNEISVYSVF